MQNTHSLLILRCDRWGKDYHRSDHAAVVAPMATVDWVEWIQETWRSSSGLHGQHDPYECTRQHHRSPTSLRRTREARGMIACWPRVSMFSARQHKGCCCRGQEPTRGEINTKRYYWICSDELNKFKGKLTESQLDEILSVTWSLMVMRVGDFCATIWEIKSSSSSLSSPSLTSLVFDSECLSSSFSSSSIKESCCSEKSTDEESSDAESKDVLRA